MRRVALLLVAFLGACFHVDDSVCSPSDPGCGLTGLLLLGCPATRWHTYFGPTGSGIATVGEVVPTSGGAIVVAGNSDAPFGSPVRPFTVNGTNRDMFALKLGYSGQSQWLTFLGGAQSDPGDLPVRALEVDGRILVSGSAGSSFENPRLPFQGVNKNFSLSFLGADGSFQENTFFGGTATFQLKGLARFSNGDLLLSGDADGGFSGTSGSNQIAFQAGGSNLTLLRVDAQGQPRWNTFVGPAGATSVSGLAAVEGASGAVFALGQPSGLLSASFTAGINTSAGAEDAVVVKFSSEGVYERHVFLGGAGTDKPRTMVATPDGGVALAFDTLDSIGSPIVAHSGPGVNHDIAVAKFNANLELQWITNFATGQTSANDFMQLANLPGGGLVLSSGATASTGQPLYPFQGGLDIVLVRFNADGSRRDHLYVGGAASSELAVSVAPTCDGGLVTSGFAIGGYGAPISPLPITSGAAAIVAKLGPDLRPSN
jgi:hypothetical protein